jgi:hypothetical protein
MLLDDVVRLVALKVGHESDAAGVVFEARVVETLRRRQTTMQTAVSHIRLIRGKLEFHRRDPTPNDTTAPGGIL